MKKTPPEWGVEGFSRIDLIEFVLHIDKDRASTRVAVGGIPCHLKVTRLIGEWRRSIKHIDNASAKLQLLRERIASGQVPKRIGLDVTVIPAGISQTRDVLVAIAREVGIAQGQIERAMNPINIKLVAPALNSLVVTEHAEPIRQW